jgi:hypothetical protein
MTIIPIFKQKVLILIFSSTLKTWKRLGGDGTSFLSCSNDGVALLDDFEVVLEINVL